MTHHCQPRYDWASNRKDVGLLTMSAQNRFVLFLSCLLLAGGVGPAVGADCAALIQQFDAAFSSRSLPQVLDLEAKMSKGEGCPEPDIRKARLSRATLQFDLVKAMILKGAPRSEYDPMLLAASELLWQAAVLIGNTKTKERDFVAATVAYERAIELVKNPSTTPIPPGEKTIKAIVDSATESRILAANERVDRDGQVGGTMRVTNPYVRHNYVPLPINFETSSAKFTETGQKYAEELLLALQQQSPQQIILVGHTDVRGEPGYNMRLSGERVKALAAYLKQHGINAKIITIAKGKTEPFQPTDPSQFTKEEIWALSRRVEWKRQ